VLAACTAGKKERRRGMAVMGRHGRGGGRLGGGCHMAGEHRWGGSAIGRRRLRGGASRQRPCHGGHGRGCTNVHGWRQNRGGGGRYHVGPLQRSRGRAVQTGLNLIQNLNGSKIDSNSSKL
jgi:hypothetical protein